VPASKPFVLNILVSKFFENHILRDPFFETRAGQAFQGRRKKKNHPGIRRGRPIQPNSRETPNFISHRNPQEKTPAQSHTAPASEMRIRAQGRASSPSAVARSYDAKWPRRDSVYGRVFGRITGKTSEGL
jgi:hypothetical protein